MTTILDLERSLRCVKDDVPILIHFKESKDIPDTLEPINSIGGNIYEEMSIGVSTADKDELGIFEYAPDILKAFSKCNQNLPLYAMNNMIKCDIKRIEIWNCLEKQDDSKLFHPYAAVVIEAEQI